jgi:hypothetical protein
MAVNSLFCHSFFSPPFWVFICSFHIETDGWFDCARRNGISRASITSSIVPWKVNHYSAWKLLVTADFILHRFPKDKLKINKYFSLYFYVQIISENSFSVKSFLHSAMQACRTNNYFCNSKWKICWWKYVYDTVSICDTEKARRKWRKFWIYEL